MFCEMVIIGTMCLTGVQLDYLNISEQRTMHDVAYSYDGMERDVSKFYKPEEPSVKAGGSFFIDDNIKLSLQYDNGYESMKYKRDDSLSIQYTQLFDIKENHYVTFSGGTVIGGEDNHTSCKDSYGREYYCGSLTAWSDFKTDHDTPWNASLTYTMRF